VEWKRVRSAGIGAFQTGNRGEAESLLSQAVGLAESFGERDPRLAKSLGELAELQRQGGELASAEKLLIRAIEIFEKLGDHHHPDLAPNLNNLAGLYYTQGNGVRAEGLYRRALDIWKSVIPADDKRLAPIYYNLGTLRKAGGAFEDAEKFYQRALDIAEKHWGAEHAHTAKCRSSYLEAQQLAQAAS
jgi:tetratricopeptide (TPR) repeat protein